MSDSGSSSPASSPASSLASSRTSSPAAPEAGPRGSGHEAPEYLNIPSAPAPGIRESREATLTDPGGRLGLETDPRDAVVRLHELILEGPSELFPWIQLPGLPSDPGGAAPPEEQALRDLRRLRAFDRLVEAALQRQPLWDAIRAKVGERAMSPTLEAETLAAIPAVSDWDWGRIRAAVAAKARVRSEDAEAILRVFYTTPQRDFLEARGESEAGLAAHLLQSFYAACGELEASLTADAGCPDETTDQQVEAGDRQAEPADWQVEAAGRQAEAADRQAEATERQVEAGDRQAEAADWQVEAADRQAEVADRQAEAATQWRGVLNVLIHFRPALAWLFLHKLQPGSVGVRLLLPQDLEPMLRGGTGGDDFVHDAALALLPMLQVPPTPGPGPSSAPDSRPVSSADSRPDSRPDSGPGAEPVSGPASGPAPGPVAGPVSGPVSTIGAHEPAQNVAPAASLPERAKGTAEGEFAPVREDKPAPAPLSPDDRPRRPPRGPRPH